jgi:hypothetical protein
MYYCYFYFRIKMQIPSLLFQNLYLMVILKNLLGHFSDLDTLLFIFFHKVIWFILQILCLMAAFWIWKITINIRRFVWYFGNYTCYCRLLLDNRKISLVNWLIWFIRNIFLLKYLEIIKTSYLFLYCSCHMLFGLKNRHQISCFLYCLL